MLQTSSGAANDFLIVTPVLNGRRFVDDCVSSVAIAFRNFRYVHVIVDGGSVDGTIEHIRAQIGDRLCLIEAPGTSMYEALNIGLRIAPSRLFYQLNIDDLVMPNTPARVWHEFERNPSLIMLTGACLTIDQRSGLCKMKFPLPDQWSIDRVGVNLFISQPSTFVSHSFLLVEGGYDEHYRYAGDTELWLRMIQRGYTGLAVMDVLAIDRLYDSSARLSVRHEIELREVRERYAGCASRSPFHRVRNGISYAIHNIICLGRGYGFRSDEGHYCGGFLARIGSFVFSGMASVRLYHPSEAGKFVMEGRIF